MEHSFIWSLTLGPIVVLYKIIFEFCYYLTHNYGVSLLLLSIATSVLMIPLGKWAVRVASKQKKIEDLLRPQIVSIKERFVGSERQEAIERLYRRYRYNPLQAVLGATGVLIQLPFLIGAFYMLSEFDAIKGVSFGLIKNLAEPDYLIGRHINLLPVVMTMFNMAATYLNPNFNSRERNQAYVIALLFLILLYRAPSALLIYWTCNNLIAFGKVAVGRVSNLKFHLRKKFFLPNNSDLRAVFWLATLGLLFFILSRAKCGFSIYFKFISDSCFIISICFCLVKLMFNKARKIDNNELILLIGVFLLSAFSLVRFVFIYGFQGSGDRFSSQLLINLILVLLFKCRGYVLFLFNELRRQKVYKLFLPVCILTASLIFLYFPLVLYNSDSAAFIQDSKSIIKIQFVYFEVSVLIVFVLNFYINKDLKILFSVIILSGIIAALVWNFWNDPKLGVMSNYKFQHAYILSKTNLENFYIIAFSISFVALILLVLKTKVDWLQVPMWFISLTLIVFPFVYSSQGKIDVSHTRQPTQISDQLKDFLTFNKNGKNIIVIMLDMFSPSDMEILLKVRPDLRTSFSSFTWYPDTLSSGISTIFGKAPLLGGEAASPWILNEDKTLSLEEKVNRAWSVFFEQLIRHGFKVELNDNKWYSWFDPKYYNNSVLSNIIVNKDESPLIARWDLRNNYQNTILSDPSVFLSLYGLFKVSPLSVKRFIYEGGKWRGKIDRVEKIELTHRELPLLDALSTEILFSNASDNKFKFISTMLTHVHRNLNECCKPSSVPVSSELYSSIGIKWNPRLQSELCALESVGKFLHSLKKNGVYANSMILVVSDHGNEKAYVPSKVKGLSSAQLRDGSLLLIKSFGNNGLDLKVSEDLTTNYDVPQFVLNALNESDSTPWKNKQRKRMTVHGDWRRNFHPDTHYKIKEIFTVRGSMFDRSNWEKVRQ